MALDGHFVSLDASFLAGNSFLAVDDGQSDRIIREQRERIEGSSRKDCEGETVKKDDGS